MTENQDLLDAMQKLNERIAYLEQTTNYLTRSLEAILQRMGDAKSLEEGD